MAIVTTSGHRVARESASVLRALAAPPSTISGRTPRNSSIKSCKTGRCPRRLKISAPRATISGAGSIGQCGRSRRDPAREPFEEVRRRQRRIEHCAKLSSAARNWCEDLVSRRTGAARRRRPCNIAGSRRRCGAVPRRRGPSRTSALSTRIWCSYEKMSESGSISTACVVGPALADTGSGIEAGVSITRCRPTMQDRVHVATWTARRTANRRRPVHRSRDGSTRRAQ